MKKKNIDYINVIVSYTGTKHFLIALSLFLTLYMIVNIVLDKFFNHHAFDPAPFLYLNTFISIFSVFTFTFVAINAKNSTEPTSRHILEHIEQILSHNETFLEQNRVISERLEALEKKDIV